MMINLSYVGQHMEVHTEGEEKNERNNDGKLEVNGNAF